MRPMLASVVSWFRFLPWAFSSDKIFVQTVYLDDLLAQCAGDQVIGDSHPGLFGPVFHSAFVSASILAVMMAVFFFWILLLSPLKGRGAGALPRRVRPAL